MATLTATLSPGTGRIDRIWADLSTADRHVLLGHDNDTLTAVDRGRLAKVIAALGRARREGARPVRRQPRRRLPTCA